MAVRKSWSVWLQSMWWSVSMPGSGRLFERGLSLSTSAIIPTKWNYGITHTISLRLYLGAGTQCKAIGLFFVERTRENFQRFGPCPRRSGVREYLRSMSETEWTGKHYGWFIRIRRKPRHSRSIKEKSRKTELRNPHHNVYISWNLRSRDPREQRL